MNSERPKQDTQAEEIRKMNEHSMTFKAYFSKVILAGTLAGILLLTGDCAFAQSSVAERNYNNAVDELEKAYAAIGLEKQRI